jgi:hypothetical protein
VTLLRARAGEATLAMLVIVFVLGHLPSLPDSLEDIDSVNFALGVRDFDVARHRPHPPGYPAYVALAKTAVAAGALVSSEARDPASPERSTLEAQALGVLSLVAAVVAILFLYRLFSCLSRSEIDRLDTPWRMLDARALAATALTAACPLFWYMAMRPMSDAPGLAASLASLACLALAWWRQQPASDGDTRLDAAHMVASGRMIVLGAFLAALSIGFRSQNAVLTVPFLVAVLFDRIGRGAAGALLGSAVAFGIGGLVWGIPLLVASGGFNAYLAALGQQAGEDFAGVEMLYMNPSPRLAATALVRTLVYPWDSLALGSVMVALAAIGVLGLMWRDRRTFVALALIGLPYAAFHLLFHDMDFVRYALPIVPVVVFLAVQGLSLIVRQGALPVSGALALWSVAIASPVLYAYGAEASPVARVVAELRAAQDGASPVYLGMHQTFQRPLEAEVLPMVERLPSPPRREWLELVRYWREGNTAPLWFLADPRRTDLALIDPKSRNERRRLVWRFDSLSGLGGMRPAAVDWYQLAPPGWFADEGWALTPETAGIARTTGRGPHLGPITAWVRSRPGAADVLIGGRQLGSAHDSPAAFTMTIDGRSVATWDAGPGFFLKRFRLPAGALARDSAPLVRLQVSSAGTGAATSIEQFDLQDEGALMWGFDDGWYEAEYNPRVGLWRWASERAAVRIVNAVTPVELRLHVESPLRNFDGPSTVKLSAGGHLFAELALSDTAIVEARVPPDALRAGGGLVFLETNQTFVPAERGGSADQRRLGLRVFGVSVAVPN